MGKAASLGAEPMCGRMPVIVREGDYDEWLDPQNHSVEALNKLLSPSNS